jgi:hypothetical protein
MAWVVVVVVEDVAVSVSVVAWTVLVVASMPVERVDEAVLVSDDEITVDVAEE